MLHVSYERRHPLQMFSVKRTSRLVGDNLDLEADNSLSKVQEKSNEVPLVLTNHDTNTLKDSMSFRVHQVNKKAKNERFHSIIEKKLYISNALK